MQLLKTLYLCENPIERYLVTVHICYLVFGPLCLFQCLVNARGIRGLFQRKALFFHCQGKGADVCFIQESHACSEDAAFWKVQFSSVQFIYIAHLQTA